MSDRRITISSQPEEDTLVNHEIGEDKIDDLNNHWDRAPSQTNDDMSASTHVSGETDADDISSLDSVKDDEAYLIQDEDSLPYVKPILEDRAMLSSYPNIKAILSNITLDDKLDERLNRSAYEIYNTFYEDSMNKFSEDKLDKHYLVKSWREDIIGRVFNLTLPLAPKSVAEALSADNPHRDKWRRQFLMNCLSWTRWELLEKRNKPVEP
jgi:hypothetical protein